MKNPLLQRRRIELRILNGAIAETEGAFPTFPMRDAAGSRSLVSYQKRLPLLWPFSDIDRPLNALPKQIPRRRPLAIQKVASGKI